MTVSLLWATACISALMAIGCTTTTTETKTPRTTSTIQAAGRTSASTSDPKTQVPHVTFTIGGFVKTGRSDSSASLNSKVLIDPRTGMAVTVAASGPTANDREGECPAFTHRHATVEEVNSGKDYPTPLPDLNRGLLVAPPLDGLCHDNNTDKPIEEQPKLPKPNIKQCPTFTHYHALIGHSINDDVIEGEFRDMTLAQIVEKMDGQCHNDWDDEPVINGRPALPKPNFKPSPRATWV